MIAAFVGIHQLNHVGRKVFRSIAIIGDANIPVKVDLQSLLVAAPGYFTKLIVANFVNHFITNDIKILGKVAFRYYFRSWVGFPFPLCRLFCVLFVYVLSLSGSVHLLRLLQDFPAHFGAFFGNGAGRGFDLGRGMQGLRCFSFGRPLRRLFLSFLLGRRSAGSIAACKPTMLAVIFVVVVCQVIETVLLAQEKNNLQYQFPYFMG